MIKKTDMRRACEVFLGIKNDQPRARVLVRKPRVIPLPITERRWYTLWLWRHVIGHEKYYDSWVCLWVKDTEDSTRTEAYKKWYFQPYTTLGGETVEILKWEVYMFDTMVRSGDGPIVIEPGDSFDLNYKIGLGANYG